MLQGLDGKTALEVAKGPEVAEVLKKPEIATAWPNTISLHGGFEHQQLQQEPLFYSLLNIYPVRQTQNFGCSSLCSESTVQGSMQLPLKIQGCLSKWCNPQYGTACRFAGYDLAVSFCCLYTSFLSPDFDSACCVIYCSGVCL